MSRSMRRSRVRFCSFARAVSGAALAAAFVFAVGCEGETQTPPGAPIEKLTTDVGTDDVSFLYPLTVPHAQRLELLGTTSKGSRGVLLPRALYDALPVLDVLSPNEDLYSLFRVVSVRIDPCFPGLGVVSESDCKNQVRLVAQPVLPLPESGLTTTDVALHLFFTLSRAELSRLLGELVALREAGGVAAAAREGRPGVHPLLGQGLASPAAKKLRETLLGYVGASTLTRVTFMGLEQVGLGWRFGGFDVRDGKLVPFAIPSAETEVQSFANRDVEGRTFEAAEAFPSTKSMAELSLFFDRKRLEAAPSEDLTRALGTLYRLENPKAHSPDTVDCVSCHVAQAAKSYAASVRPLVGGEAERYREPKGEAPEGEPYATNQLRAFGYFGSRPSVSARVVNETAEVVAHVNAVVKTK